MRNLKLKKVLPVATETETLQKNTHESDVGLHLVTDSVESVSQSSPDLQGVKETPGLHVMGDLFEVQCDDRYMLDAEFLKNHCVRLVKESGLTTVGEFFKQFDGAGGVTGTVVLAESHLCIHTWPEKSYVTVDVYVCSYTQDNRPRARKLYQSLLDTFQPKSEKAHAVERL